MTGSCCDCSCSCGYWPPPQTEGAPADAWWKEAIRHENSKSWYLRPAPEAWANTFGGSQVEDLIKHQIEPPSDLGMRPQGRRVLQEPRQSAEFGDVVAWDPCARSQELTPRGRGYAPAAPERYRAPAYGPAALERCQAPGYVPAVPDRYQAPGYAPAALERYQAPEQDQALRQCEDRVAALEAELQKERRRSEVLRDQSMACPSSDRGYVQDANLDPRYGQQRDRPEMVDSQGPSVRRQPARDRQHSKEQERILRRQREAEEAWLDRHRRHASDERDDEQPIDRARPALDEQDGEEPIDRARPARTTTPARLSHARMMQKTQQQPFSFVAPSRVTTRRREACRAVSSTFGICGDYGSSRGRARSADVGARARRAW